MPALDAAVAFPEVAGIAVAVAEDLDLDVPDLAEEALKIHIAPPERRLRFGDRLWELG